MAKTKKKQLPKDFEALLQKSDIAALKVLFEKYDVNARGGVFKQSALAFNQCPDNLAHWLVEQGADLAAIDSYGNTPLHSRSGHWQARRQVTDRCPQSELGSSAPGVLGATRAFQWARKHGSRRSHSHFRSDPGRIRAQWGNQLGQWFQKNG